MEAQWETAFMALGLTTLLAIGILVIAFDEPVGVGSGEPISVGDAEWVPNTEEQNPIILDINSSITVTDGDIQGSLSIVSAD